MFRLLSLISLVLFPFIPVHLFCLTLPYHPAINNHVVLFSSCPVSCVDSTSCHSIAPPPNSEYPFLLCLLISEHLLYLNRVSPLIQNNLIIVCIFCFMLLALSSLVVPFILPCVPYSDHLRSLSNHCPTSVRLQPLTSAPKL